MHLDCVTHTMPNLPKSDAIASTNEDEGQVQGEDQVEARDDDDQDDDDDRERGDYEDKG